MHKNKMHIFKKFSNFNLKSLFLKWSLWFVFMFIIHNYIHVNLRNSKYHLNESNIERILMFEKSKIWSQRSIKSNIRLKIIHIDTLRWISEKMYLNNDNMHHKCIKCTWQCTNNHLIANINCMLSRLSKNSGHMINANNLQILARTQWLRKARRWGDFHGPRGLEIRFKYLIWLGVVIFVRETTHYKRINFKLF